jgi:hypothetical protein
MTTNRMDGNLNIANAKYARSTRRKRNMDDFEKWTIQQKNHNDSHAEGIAKMSGFEFEISALLMIMNEVLIKMTEKLDEQNRLCEEKCRKQI